MPEFETTKLA